MTPLAVALVPILVGFILLALALVGFVALRRSRPAVPKPDEAPPPAPQAPAAPTEAPPTPEIAAAPEVAPAPPRRRVRSIGASLSRLFKGTALSEQEWEELEEVLLRADVGVAATQ